MLVVLWVEVVEVGFEVVVALVTGVAPPPPLALVLVLVLPPLDPQPTATAASRAAPAPACRRSAWPR